MAPEPLPVVPSGPLDATVRVPGSKSWTQRALCLAALADGESTIRGWGDNEDVRRCAEAVERLGAQVGIAPGEIRVRGPAQAERAELDLGGSGTAFRFMIGLCLALPGDFLLDGNASLRARPIGPLARAASDLGAAIRWMGREGYPPLRLASFGLTPKRVLVDASVSSQFLSALLIAGAAVDPPGLSVRTTGPVASASYVDMTVAALRAFGVRVHAADHSQCAAPFAKQLLSKDVRAADGMPVRMERVIAMDRLHQINPQAIDVHLFDEEGRAADELLAHDFFPVAWCESR